MSNLDSLKLRWKNVPSGIRKPAVFVVGAAIVVGGIILLPLPGPGWVIIFAGFALLATEFTFAEKVKDWLVNVFKQAIVYFKKVWYKLRGQTESSQRPHDRSK